MNKNEEKKSPYINESHGVRITVWPKYDEANSRPTSSLFIYSYTILIENFSSDVVQLMNRHWIIRDAFGGVEEVRGAGVVGKQPLLQPGEVFEYTSYCPLKTPSGSMEGSFEMRNNLNEKFEAPIARFELKSALLQN
jgi:ApaG protein